MKFALKNFNLKNVMYESVLQHKAKSFLDQTTYFDLDFLNSHKMTYRSKSL